MCINSDDDDDEEEEKPILHRNDYADVHPPGVDNGMIGMQNTYEASPIEARVMIKPGPFGLKLDGHQAIGWFASAVSEPLTHLDRLCVAATRVWLQRTCACRPIWQKGMHLSPTLRRG